MTGKETGKISSLRELPRDIAPPRDLWQGIEARLAAEPRGAGDRGQVGAGVGAGESAGRWRVGRTNRMRMFGVAAMVATLAVGVWIGRSGVMFGGAPAGGGMTAAVPAHVAGTGSGAALGNEPEALRAAYVMDSRYTRERAALVKTLETQLATLPPETRAKVMSSLSTIHDSIRDLQAALGRDPTNTLLQELLVNTYQDEMRVLTAVHEAGTAGKGI